MSKKQMKERCPDSKALVTAVLPNYKLIFSGWSRQWRGGVASIRHFRGEKVPGVIYEITDKCLQRLDKFEGYPKDYNRINVNVFKDDGDSIPAVTYIKEGHEEETAPSEQYVSVMKQGYRDWGIV